MLKPYLYGAIVFSLIGSNYYFYKAGKQAVLQSLSNDRVEVLKDGQKVDADVLAADDSSLFCMLINCETN